MTLRSATEKIFRIIAVAVISFLITSVTEVVVTEHFSHVRTPGDVVANLVHSGQLSYGGRLLVIVTVDCSIYVIIIVALIALFQRLFSTTQ